MEGLFEEMQLDVPYMLIAVQTFFVCLLAWLICTVSVDEE